jgi:hypothetical protein
MEAAVAALRRRLDAADHPSLEPPAPGGVAELAVAAHLVTLARDPAKRRVLGPIGHPGEQHWVAGEAEDVADPVALATGHGLVAGVVAVAADQDLDPRPASADGFHDMAQDEGDLGTARRLARPQDDRDRFAGGGLVDVDRQEAAAVVMGVEQGELLAAVDPILGIVDVEDEMPRHVLEAVAEQLDHRRHHPLEGGRTREVLEPAHDVGLRGPHTPQRLG